MGTRDERRAQIRNDIERRLAARALVVARACVSQADLIATNRTLRALGAVELDDPMVPPGFTLLPDGQVGQANTETQEWRDWSAAHQLVETSINLASDLIRIANELVLAKHWEQSQTS
jgi:hypothetical protein